MEKSTILPLLLIFLSCTVHQVSPSLAYRWSLKATQTLAYVGANICSSPLHSLLTLKTEMKVMKKICYFGLDPNPTEVRGKTPRKFMQILYKVLNNSTTKVFSVIYLVKCPVSGKCFREKKLEAGRCVIILLQIGSLLNP